DAEIVTAVEPAEDQRARRGERAQRGDGGFRRRRDGVVHPANAAADPLVLKTVRQARETLRRCLHPGWRSAPRPDGRERPADVLLVVLTGQRDASTRKEPLGTEPEPTVTKMETVLAADRFGLAGERKPRDVVSIRGEVEKSITRPLAESKLQLRAI